MRVLIVEDNRDAADALALLLRLKGHEVTSVHTGRAALEDMGDFVPDVAFVDLGLPDTTGDALARELAARDAYRHTTFVALSGREVEPSPDSPFIRHLLKPANFDDLYALMRDLETDDDASDSTHHDGD